MKYLGFAILLFALATVFTPLDNIVLASDGNWVNRSQIFHMPGQSPGETFQIRRYRVSAWNGQEEKDLEFIWEPRNPPGLDENGKITGHGELTWRKSGIPQYDDVNRYSVYSGEFLGGKRHGHGRDQRHNGVLYIGEWKNDRFDGEGRLTNANGDFYEGTFLNGAFDGFGEQTLHSGEVYKGTFQNGSRHGKARILTADGRILLTHWAYGEQIFVKTTSTAEPESAPEIRLVAGQNSGQAEKVDIGLSINQELNLENRNAEGVGYFHRVHDKRIDVYPEDDTYVNHWKGTATANSYFPLNTNSIFMNISFKGKGGHKFGLKELVFDVEESLPFNKPMLTTGRNEGCVGFRPDFHLMNSGWGAVENTSIEFVFGNEDGSKKSDRVFKMDIPNFDKATDVVIRETVAKMGADIGALNKQSLPVCPSLDQRESCLKTAIPTLPIGQLAEYVYTDWGNVNVKIFGKINYHWLDHSRKKRPASESFSTAITLAVQTFKQIASECSDLPFMAPEARRLMKVSLPSNKKNYKLTYVVNLPLDSGVDGTLDISSDRSSTHRLRVGARFSDGSSKMSKPLNLYFFKPRTLVYEDLELGKNIDLPICNPNLDSPSC